MAPGRVTLALVLLAAAPVAAQSDRTASESLRDASDRVAVGDHGGAVRILQAATREHDDPRLDFALADSLARLGHLERAEAILGRLGSANPIVAEAARERLREVEARFAHLEVVVSPPREDAVITVNGAPEPTARSSGVSVRLEPGEHRVEVRGASDEVLAAESVRLFEGQRTTVELRPRAPAPDPRVVASVTASGPRQVPETSPRSPGAPAIVPTPRRPTPRGSAPSITAASVETSELPEAGSDGDGWVPWAVGGGIAGAVVIATVVVVAVVAAPQPTRGDADPIVVRGSP